MPARNACPTWKPPRWAGWALAPLVLVAMAAWLDVACGRMPGWPELVLLVAAMGSVALGVFSLRSQALGPAFCGRCPGRTPRVALTFDDGPDPWTTPRVLDGLGLERATFFTVGAKARANPELIGAIRARGHAILPHGERHSWTALLTVRRARALVQDGITSLRAQGIEPAPLFRPPYGLTTPPLQLAARETGSTLVGWSLRSWDTVRAGSPQRFAARLAARIRNGDIVLLHDAAQSANGRAPLGVAAIGDLVRELKARGFRLVTVEELLRDDR